MKKLVIISLLLVAVAAVFVQYNGMANKRKNLASPDLGKLIPSEIPGWTIEDKPIAATPEMQKAVDSLLNFDAGILRVYKQGTLEITVYMAYWLPAKVPAEIVDAHTPDICWVLNGWQMTKCAPLPDQSTPTGLVALPNVRQFDVSGTQLSVVYWHMKDHKIRTNNPLLIRGLSFFQHVKWRFTQFWQLITSTPSEQIFIRISANQDIAEIIQTDPIQFILDLIAQIQSNRVLATEDFSNQI